MTKCYEPLATIVGMVCDVALNTALRLRSNQSLGCRVVSH
jgi:hypothetical protein